MFHTGGAKGALPSHPSGTILGVLRGTMNNLNSKERAKLAAELDRETKWFQKAARHYRTRQWARDLRRALGITMDFLAEETEVGRTTLYRTDQREESGAITIGELEALAEAMECKLVYAIVPGRGTVAELAERRKDNPRKPRTQREKEEKEYMEQYAKYVERMQDPGTQAMAAWRKELEAKIRGDQGSVAVRPPGAQRLRDAVAGAVAELGPEGEKAIRQKAGSREQEQGTGNRE